MKKSDKTKEIKVVKSASFQEIENHRTFAEWLRSTEGLGYIKLFIIGNTIVLFLTLSWPHIEEILNNFYYSYKSMF